jgi:hypothetical protein
LAVGVGRFGFVAGWVYFSVEQDAKKLQLNFIFQQLKRILLTTLFATLLGCLIAGVLFLFESSGMALYGAILTFGNIIIPTLLGVLIFQIVKSKINFANETKTLVLRMLVLIVMFILALVIWAIGDVAFSDLTLQNIKEDFNSQFSGFSIIAISLAIAIPSIDILMDGKPQKPQ